MTSRQTYNFLLLGLIAYMMAMTSGLIGEIAGLILGNNMDDYLRTAVFTLGLGFVFMIVFPILHVKYIEKRPAVTMGYYKKGMIKKYLLGSFIGLVFMAVIVGLGLGLGAYDISSKTITGGGLVMIAVMLLGFMIQGAAEEVLVRGWMLPVLAKRYNVAWAIVLSSVFFAAIHAMNPGMTLMPVVNLILVGIFLALYYLIEDSLWGVFGFHSFWNWVQGNVFGIKVSGSNLPGGSIFTTRNVEGKDLISGGSFGAEGGVLCTAILILGILVCLFMMKKRSENE